jgi:hypothetical protein
MPDVPTPARVRYRSIFTPSSRRERNANFEDYWEYCLRHDGDLLEKDRDLTKKRQALERFLANPIRSRRPLPDPKSFYRNFVTMQDDPQSLDRKTLLLTFLYKFARHEYVGIVGAWEAMPPMAQLTTLTGRISRYHLCEEFGHIRLFHEMFRTFHLDRVEWLPLGKWMSRLYRVFPHLPGPLLSPPAFVSELMGLTLYRYIDGALDRILADEPEARDRLRALLLEILTDELAHVGQRRNFIGPLGLSAARRMVGPMYRAFFADMPETKLLFDVDRMIEDGKAFDYSTIAPEVIANSWVPSYCKA